MATTKLGLPLISGNMNADVARDMNALAQAIDEKVASIDDVTTANKVKNLGFRGFIGDTTNGIGPTDGILKYPDGISALYTDTSEWAVFLSITDFLPTQEFLFIETHRTAQDGKINAVQEITRYKKEATGAPVKLIERFTRVWYSDTNYSGWSNAEKAVSNAVLAAHLADEVKHITGAERTAWNAKLNASDLKDATTAQKGIVQLDNTVTSTSTTHAATANAVKTAYDKAVEAFGFTEVEAGDLEIYNNPNTGSVNTNSTVFTKLSEVTSNIHGILRFKFTMGVGIGITGTAQIFINDSAVGTPRTITYPTNNITFTEDIPIKKGDRLQLMVKSSGNNTNIKNYILSKRGDLVT